MIRLSHHRSVAEKKNNDGKHTHLSCYDFVSMWSHIYNDKRNVSVSGKCACGKLLCQMLRTLPNVLSFIHPALPVL